MQTKVNQKLVTIRLWREILSRTRYGGWTHLHYILLASIFCYDMHTSNPATLVAYGFILIGCSYRYFVFKRIQKVGFFPKFHLEMLYHLCMFSMGLGWGLFWIDVHSYYGQFSIHFTLTYLIWGTILSGAAQANSTRPIGYLCLALPMILIPIWQMTMLEGAESKIIGYCVLIFGVLQLVQLRNAYHYTKGFIEKDIAVSQERDKLQTLFDAVPGFVCIIDHELRYVAMNETAQEYFNLKDFFQRHISEKNKDSDYVSFVTNFIQGEQITAVTEVKYELNPGHCHAILRIQKLNDGGAMIVSIPIDELVESREIIKAQEAKSFYTAKLISLGEMAAGIAHEINNPLAIILGASAQVSRESKALQPSMPRIEMLNDKIQRTVERISLIIRSLRILARDAEKDPFVPFKIESIIDPTLEISRQRFIVENIELKVQTPSHDLICIGQEIQLSQVMMNLLSNAFDGAMDGPIPRWVRLEVRPDEEFVNICVQDSGLGIPLEIRDKIMEPFFTTKPINKGTGLGLSISKSIMEQHGGTLTLDETEKNTTFIMRIKRGSV